MSRVRDKGNKSTEIKFIGFLRQHHITGWRRHQPVFGKPDFIFSKLRVAVFIDGCFWHGCPVHGRLPSSNAEYWEQKINNNVLRDKKVSRALKQKGWQVIRIWEHELNPKNISRKINRIKRLQVNNKNLL